MDSLLFFFGVWLYALHTAALRMQGGLLISFRAFHARSTLYHLILIADPISDQQVTRKWSSSEIVWLKHGALSSCGRVEVMIRWRPVVSLANLVKSRLPYSACQRNLKQQPKWQCDYLNIIFLMHIAASKLKHSKDLCDIPIAMPWRFRALHHTERNLGCLTFLYHPGFCLYAATSFLHRSNFFFGKA